MFLKSMFLKSLFLKSLFKKEIKNESMISFFIDEVEYTINKNEIYTIFNSVLKKKFFYLVFVITKN